MAQIPNLDTAGVQEQNTDISAPQQQMTPSAPQPVQEIQKSQSDTKVNDSSNTTNNVLTQMKGVQELASQSVQAPPPSPPPVKVEDQKDLAKQQTASQQIQTGQGANPQGSGSGANATLNSASVSGGSGVQVDGNSVPSYTQNMSPEELETYRLDKQAIDVGEKNLLEFMTGSSPLDADILNKSVQQMRANQSAQLNQLKQNIMENGLTGKGEGDALLALMARDQNVAYGDMMSTLTIDARNRLEQWNKYGIEYGNKTFNTNKSNSLAELDYMINRGALPEELNEKAGQISEEYGVMLPDFTDPNNSLNYNKQKEKMSDIQAKLADRMSTGDWEGYKKIFNEEIKGKGWEQYAFADTTMPKLDDFMEDYATERKQTKMRNLEYDTQFLAENGDSKGAASLYADAYALGGVFNNGQPLTLAERAKIEQGYLSNSPEQKANDAAMTSIFNDLKQNAGTQDLLDFIDDQYKANPTSSFGLTMKYYKENPELLSRPAGYESKLNKDMRSFASKFTTGLTDLNSAEVGKYEEMLVDMHGKKGLADKGRELVEDLGGQIEELTGLTPDDLVSDEDYRQVYALYDLNQNINIMRPDAKLQQLETTIMSHVDQDKYFDSPEERAILREYLVSLSSGEMEEDEDGNLKLADTAVLPWENEKYKHKYNDLNGVDYTEGYNYSSALDDPYMAIGYSMFENEYEGVFKYEDFQRIYQQIPTEQSTSDFKVALDKKLTEDIVSLDVANNLGNSVTRLMFTSTGDRSKQITDASDGYADANETRESKKAIGRIPENEMATFLETSNATPEDIVRKMVEAGSVFDLNELYTWNDKEARFRRRDINGATIHAHNQILNESIAATDLGGYVSFEGNLMRANYAGGQWTFRPVLKDENDNEYKLTL